MGKMRFLLAVLFVFCVVGSLHGAEYIDDDDPQVDDNGYIMSWLILDPYINDGVPAATSTPKDYFEDQEGEANIMPREGDEVTIAADGEEHEWVRLNFADLKDMGQIPAPVGGNELDLQDWGGQGPTNTQTYMVTYLKWNSDTTVKFTVSADDGAELFCNGDQLIQKGVDQDWSAGNCGSESCSVKRGKWNTIVVGAYETGGEWGISVQVDPIPDEVNNIGPVELFAVEPADKLTTTWGEIRK